MIQRQEILKDREKQYPLTKEMESNLLDLLLKLNVLRQAWGKPMIISSGYRPGHFNDLAKGATRSKHMICQAVDIHDPEHALTNWLLAEPNRLKDFGFWMEHPEHCPSWTHLQTTPPPSGVRVFRIKPAMPLS